MIRSNNHSCLAKMRTYHTKAAFYILVQINSYHMPLEQLHVVEKIKFLVSNSLRTKKQIVTEAEKDADDHRQLNQWQEREDDVIVAHAVKELQAENKMAASTYERILNMLRISFFINIVFLTLLLFAGYFIFIINRT